MQKNKTNEKNENDISSLKKYITQQVSFDREKIKFKHVKKKKKEGRKMRENKKYKNEKKKKRSD